MKLKDSGWWTEGAGCNRNVVGDIAAEGLDLLHKYEFRTLIADKKNAYIITHELGTTPI